MPKRVHHYHAKWQVKKLKRTQLALSGLEGCEITRLTPRLILWIFKPKHVFDFVFFFRAKNCGFLGFELGLAWVWPGCCQGVSWVLIFGHMY